MAGNTQFNFELPEAETIRLLDVGVARRMGLTRETVQKAMIARALILERLDEICPVNPLQSVEQELLAKVAETLARKPGAAAALNKFLMTQNRAPRQSRAVAAA